MSYLQDPTTVDFQPMILIFLSICTCLYVVLLIFSYSFYLNNKMKFYRVRNVKKTLIWLLIFISLIWLSLGVWSVIDTHYFANNIYAIPISWTLFTISIAYIVAIIFIPKRLNNQKHKIDNFRNENWTQLIANLKTQSEKYTNILIKKHARYYSTIKQKYDFITGMLDKYTPQQFETYLTNIIMFNDTYTTKWSKKYNNVQLLMFYEMCLKLQQKVLQK